MIKLLTAVAAVFILTACEPRDQKPYNPLDYADLIIDGKGYNLETRCVEEKTVTKWCYHYGWSNWKTDWCWHWGYDEDTFCVEEVTDTIPL